MFAQAIAGSLDLDDDRVVKEPIEKRGGDNRIAEDLSPFGEAAVRGEDHGALFVSGVDELEEQVSAAGDDRQVSNFVDDDQGRSGKSTGCDRAARPSRSAFAREAMMSASELK